MRGTIVADKYRLNALLGKGGMAEVWSATNTFTDRQVAIKFLSRDLPENDQSIQRFMREAKVTARIDHPSVIDILDVGRTKDGQLFLVMELLQGVTLEDALCGQPFRGGKTGPGSVITLDELVVIMLAIARALAVAHQRGVVHRDLKPTNIFLHRMHGGEVLPKLVDFGVSKFMDDAQEKALKLTLTGTVLGSPFYMSPEQARGESDLDGRTDIFSFGAILFEALAGCRAYDARNFNALIVKIATTPPKSIDVAAPWVPDSLRRVVRACMEPTLRRRAQTFAEVVQLIEEALPDVASAPQRLPILAGATSQKNIPTVHVPKHKETRPMPLRSTAKASPSHGVSSLPSIVTTSSSSSSSSPLSPLPPPAPSSSYPPSARHSTRTSAKWSWEFPARKTRAPVTRFRPSIPAEGAPRTRIGWVALIAIAGVAGASAGVFAADPSSELESLTGTPQHPAPAAAVVSADAVETPAPSEPSTPVLPVDELPDAPTLGAADASTH